jgi:enterochelin esterase-like enzyme
MKTCFTSLITLLLIPVLHAQLPRPASGSIRRVVNFPSRFVEPRNVDIWLPDGYDPKKKYAVLYMQDGQMLFDSTNTWNKQEWGIDETLGGLQARKLIRDCIVVGIWNGVVLQHAEYFPQKAIDFIPPAYRPELMPLIRNKPKADDYLKFMVKELKPWVDSAYSTSPDRKNTFVAGSGMGGLISLYAVCEYPEIFQGAACLSTHWLGTYDVKDNPVPDAIVQYLKSRIPKSSEHKLYFDHGTTSLDSSYGRLQKKVDELFEANGYDASNYNSREFAGEGSSENSWNKRFYIPAIFLLRGN